MNILNWLRRFMPRRLTALRGSEVPMRKLLESRVVVDATALMDVVHGCARTKLAAAEHGKPALAAAYEQYNGICTLPPLARLLVRFGPIEFMVDSLRYGDGYGAMVSTGGAERFFGLNPKPFPISWSRKGEFRTSGAHPTSSKEEVVVSLACLLILLDVFAFCHSAAGRRCLQERSKPTHPAEEKPGAVAYHILTLTREQREEIAASREEALARRTSPMLHWVRRHERLGQVIDQYLRGRAQRGFLFKDYRLKR